MWPERRVAGVTGRSRLTRAPGARSPRLVSASVSGARSAAKESGVRSSAVRQTPFTAMLDPSLASDKTVEQRMRRRAPAARRSSEAKVPSSSTIPVNIFFQPGLDRKLIGSDGMQAHVVKQDGIGAAAASGSSRHGQRLRAAQNLGRVIKIDLVGDARLKRRPIDAASRLDHQREILFFGQQLGEAAKVGA